MKLDKSLINYEIITSQLSAGESFQAQQLLLNVLKSFSKKIMSIPNSIDDKELNILAVLENILQGLQGLATKDLRNLRFLEVIETFQDVFTVITKGASQITLTPIKDSSREFKDSIENITPNNVKDFSSNNLKDISSDLDLSTYSNQFYADNLDEMMYSITGKEDEILDPSFSVSGGLKLLENLILAKASHKTEITKIIKEEKEKPQEKEKKNTISTNLDKYSRIFKLANDFLTRVLSLPECTKILHLNDLMKLFNIFFKCIAEQQKNSSNMLKERLLDIINTLFSYKSQFSSSFYKEYIKYLHSILINQESHPDTREFYLIIIRILLIFLVSKNEVQEELTTIFNILQGIVSSIFNKTAKNIHAIVFFILFKTLSDEKKNSILTTIVDCTYQSLQTEPNVGSICIIFEILNLKENKTSSLDLMILDIASNKEELNLDQELTEELIIKNVKVSKSLFNDITVPNWISQTTREKFLKLQQEIHKVQSKLFERVKMTTELIGIITQLNCICKLISSDFPGTSLISEIDQFKANIQNCNLFTLLGIQKNLASRLPDYFTLSPNEKHHFVLHNLSFLIKFNSLLHIHKSKISSDKNENKQIVTEEETKAIVDSFENLSKNMDIIHGYVKNITNNIISWLLQQANLPINEEIIQFCNNLHVFSRFSQYKPEKFFKKYLKASGMIMNLINFSKFYRENIQKEICKYTDLLKTNDIHGFFLNIAALTINPIKHLNADDGEKISNEFAELCNQLILMILVMQENLQIFNSLLKIVRVEYKFEIPNEILKEVFVLCCENMMINNENDNYVEQEVFNEYKILEFDGVKQKKKDYIKFFFQIKKNSYLINIIKLAETLMRSGGQNSIFAQKELINLLNQLNKNELNNIEQKTAILLLINLENATSNAEIADMFSISEEFLGFAQNCIRAQLKNQSLAKSLLHIIFGFNLNFPNFEKLQKKLGENLNKEHFSKALAEKSIDVLIEFIKILEPPKPAISEKSEREKQMEKGDKHNLTTGSKPYLPRIEKVGLKKDVEFSDIISREAGSKKPSKKTVKPVTGTSKKKPILSIEKKIKPIKLKPTHQSQEGANLEVYDHSYTMYVQFYAEIGKLLVNNIINLAEIERFITHRLLSSGYNINFLKNIYAGKMEIENMLKFEDAFYISSRTELAYFLDFLKNLLSKLQGRIIFTISYDQLFSKVVEIITLILQNTLKSTIVMIKQFNKENIIQIKNNFFSILDLILVMKSIALSNSEIKFNAFEVTLCLIFEFLEDLSTLKIDIADLKTFIDEFIFQIYSFITSFVSKPGTFIYVISY